MNLKRLVTTILSTFVCLTVLLSPVSCTGNDAYEFTLDDVTLSVNNKYAAIGEQVVFTASNSPSGAAATWNWGDGSGDATGIATTHTYETEGLYTITLTVSAAGGQKELTARVKVEGVGLTRALADCNGSKVWIMAHRGNTGNSKVPENSVAAIEECIASGTVDVVEIDTRTTKDGVVVIMHNETIDATTTGSGAVADMTYSQLQQYNLMLSDGTVTSSKIPTLEEVLLAGRGKLYFDLDLKSAATKTYSVVNDCGMRDRVLYYTGGDVSLGQNFLALYSGNHVYPFYSSESSASYLYTYGRTFMVQMNCSHATSGIAQQASNKGFVVSVNHLDSTDSGVDTKMKNGDYSMIDNLLETESVHVIQTDYPLILHNYLLSKGKR